MFNCFSKYLLKVILALLVLLGILSTMSGYAFVGPKNEMIFQADVPADYHVEVSYDLDNQHPDRLGAVLIKVWNPFEQPPPSQVMTSLNNGEVWHSCKFVGNNFWKCTFDSQTVPRIEQIEYVRVVIS